MYKEHPVFEKPQSENATIWRYMDFTKFVSLLDKSALFFSRADKLGDPFEGSFSKVNVKLRPEVYKDKVPEEVLNYLAEFHRVLIKCTTVNCWHLNQYESAAMWKLYLKSEEGIAIVSTFARLKDSLQGDKPDVYIGKVQYIDYENDWIPEGNSLFPFVHKRKSFQHEQELRAVIQELPRDEYGQVNMRSKPPFDDGIYVPVNLPVLIEKIYLAPTSPRWLFELVQSIIRMYRLEINVLQSTLDDVPSY